MKGDRGTSLIESLLIVVMVGIIIVLMANLPNAFLLISKSQHLSLAKEIAAKQIEDKRAISFINLANGTQSISDTRINLLPQAAGTVTVADCDASICLSGENVKRITVNISWQDNSKLQTVKLDTFIGEGGINQ